MLPNYLNIQYVLVKIIRLLLKPFPRTYVAARTIKREFKYRFSIKRRIVATNNIFIPQNNKEEYTRKAKTELNDFFFSGGILKFPEHDSPLVSIIMVLYNRSELTFLCLRSLLENQDIPFEVIVVDNCSSDRTGDLFSRVTGVHYIRNSENVHFLLGSNQGSREAKGAYLLFLNNDTRIGPGSLSAAVRAIENNSNVGAVGGRIILPDGRLQEAGSIVWADGSCLGYGRNDNPHSAPYMFTRDVDYCSGAFLLTRRDLFENLHGFDVDYQPAYYEEADYCLRLREQGFRILYEPRIVIHHYEFASSAASDVALEMQLKRRTIFKRKRAHTLAAQLKLGSNNVLVARSRPYNRKRLLFIDDRLPHLHYGAGYPRANQIVRSALSLKWDVTLFPGVYVEPNESWESIYHDIPPTVEVIALEPWGPGPSNLRRFIQERLNFFTTILVSRPNTMAMVRLLLDTEPELFYGSRIIYDAEAIFTLREQHYHTMVGTSLTEQEIDQRLSAEFALTKGADIISAVSQREVELFRHYGFANAGILGHAIVPTGDINSFSARSGLLFVGAIHIDESPNGDAVYWFIDEIFPLILKKVPDMKLTVAGLNYSTRLQALGHPAVTVTGTVPDLAPYYNAARLFIAPTRYSAGIPLKVIEASAHGLPVVVTGLLEDQLGWHDREELLSANSAEDFAERCIELYNNEPLWQQIRQGALQRVSAEYSPQVFTEQLRVLFEG